MLQKQISYRLKYGEMQRNPKCIFNWTVEFGKEYAFKGKQGPQRAESEPVGLAMEFSAVLYDLILIAFWIQMTLN